MKIGFTGARKPMTGDQFAALADLISGWQATEVHHGECEGADWHVDVIVRLARDGGSWQHRGIHPKLVAHPGVDKEGKSPFRAEDCRPDERREELPYIERNHNIVDETDLLIACVSGPERRRSGTWATVRYAVKKNKPVHIIYPSGEVVLYYS